MIIEGRLNSSHTHTEWVSRQRNCAQNNAFAIMASTYVIRCILVEMPTARAVGLGSCFLLEEVQPNK